MSALDTIERISESNLLFADLRYCLVSDKKLPFKTDSSIAKINNVDDFVQFEDLLQCNDLDSYAGVGISIQASKICAIDVDHCFSNKFDISSGDNRAKDLLEFFNSQYCEFSFSGTGLRILFDADVIEDYSEKWYIKNEKLSIEYYQPYKSFRYVTITGKVICDNDIRDKKLTSDKLEQFLNKYMLKQKRNASEVSSVNHEIIPEHILKQKLKYLYLTNIAFQEHWFAIAPGSGKNESELDFALLSYIYEHITQNKEQVKSIFESSPYFKSKDAHHIYKWNNLDFRYFNYVYDVISKSHKGV